MSSITEIEETLKEILQSDGEVPSRVTNRLLLAAIIQTRLGLEERIDALEEKINENPSLVLMFKRRPGHFLRYFLVIVLIISLLAAAAVAGDDILSFFISLLGAI